LGKCHNFQTHVHWFASPARVAPLANLYELLTLLLVEDLIDVLY